MPVTPADGLVIMLTLGEVGLPMGQMELVHSLVAGATGELRERLTAQGNAIMSDRDVILGKLDDIDARLRRSGLPEPTRPDSYPQYMLWAQAIQQLVADATGPSTVEGGCAALGRTLGDLIQNISMQIVVRFLLEVAPEHARLKALDQQLAATRSGAATQVQAMSKYPTVLDALRAPAEKIAVIGRALETLAEGPAGTATLRIAFRKIASELGELRARVEPAAPATLN